jgi:hypothetical protein
MFGTPSLHILDFQNMGTSMPSNSPPKTSLLSLSQALNPGMGAPLKSPSKGHGMAPDFAEMARVHAATASPLRRRASARMVEQAGIEMPAPLARMQHQRASPQFM